FSVFELSQSISGGKFLSLRELNQILLLEKGTGFEKYNKGNDSNVVTLTVQLYHFIRKENINEKPKPLATEKMLSFGH
ncbi:hypothetical protein ACTGXY_10050, partial [Streptococcus suis]